MKPKKDRAPFLVRLFDPRMWLYDLVKLNGIPIALYTRMKRIFVTHSGMRKRDILKGKYLVACNHTSCFDPVLLMNAFFERRLVFVAMEELFELKFGKFFKWIGCIPINRENVSIETFKKVENQLYRGHVVGVFPEGSIETENTLKAFKSGIALMAAMSGADIVPTFLAKRTNVWHRQVVLIGEKIKLADYISSEFPTMEELDNLTQALQEKELELERTYQEMQEKKGRKK